MAIGEEARHELYLALERRLGHDQASTLMELLPPVGWADVATKRDLEMQDLRLEAVEGRLTALIERRIGDALRVHVLTSVGAVMTAVSLSFAAARL
jgi:hypothetical protein